MSNNDVTGQQTALDVFKLDICIKYEESLCCITGIAILSPNVLIISDSETESVKLVDAEKGIVKACLILPICPIDITVMEKDRAAVTLPGRSCIQIFKIDEYSGRYKLLLDTSISVNGECSGIDYDQSSQCFVVSFKDPVKLELIRTDGAVVWNLGREIHIERPN